MEKRLCPRGERTLPTAPSPTTTHLIVCIVSRAGSPGGLSYSGWVGKLEEGERCVSTISSLCSDLDAIGKETARTCHGPAMHRSRVTPWPVVRRRCGHTRAGHNLRDRRSPCLYSWKWNEVTAGG